MEEIFRYLVASFTALGLLLVLLFITYIIFISWTYWKFHHIPSPKRNSFLFGHIPNVEQRNSPMHKLYYNWYKEVGQLYVVFFIFHVFIITMDPDDIKILFGEDFNSKPRKFVNYFRFLCGQRLLGNGLISSPDYQAWKKRRRAYDPAFHKSTLKGHIPAMNYCAQRMIKRLFEGTQLNCGHVMMKEFIEDYTADIICTILFSVDYEKSEELLILNDHQVSLREIASLLNTLYDAVRHTIHSSFLLRILHPFVARNYQKDAKIFRELGRRWIMKRIAACNSGIETPKDALHFMLEFASKNEEINLEDIVDDFATFYAAGHGTTSSFLCFTIVEIHQNPTVLERLEKEVKEVIGDSKDITDSQLQQLSYMEQVFMEVLRCYPLVSSFIRESPKGGITLSNYHIPQGTLISIVNSVLSNTSEHFQDADVFNPDRFDKLYGRFTSRYIYFPFGVGQRNCIGKHFAMMEAKIILAKLLQNFSFKLPHGYKLRPDRSIICQPQGQLPFCVFPK